MCKFKSAIVTKNLDILHNGWTDAHEDLIRIFGLNDTPTIEGEPRFARIEFSPENENDFDKPEKYKLVIDEGRMPGWFDERAIEKVTEKMRMIIDRMIVRKDTDLICGGSFILADGVTVKEAKSVFIPILYGSANIGEVYGFANIGHVYGFANIGHVYDSANIGHVHDSANIGSVYESANIGHVHDSANIGSVYESANIGSVSGSAKIIKDSRVK